MTLPKETYLGDGVYASFDGWHIWLRAPREGGDHKIALESSVYTRLTEYVRDVANKSTPGATPGAST